MLLTSRLIVKFYLCTIPVLHAMLQAHAADTQLTDCTAAAAGAAAVAVARCIPGVQGQNAPQGSACCPR